jgi:hypothetical protein
MMQPVLITGIPRSGANVIGAAINHCGAFGGVMGKQNQDFDEGKYSNNRIRDKVVKPYFDRNGFDSKGQFPIPKTGQVGFNKDWKNKIEEILYSEGYKEQQWMYLDSKSCLIWPVWNNAYPGAKWVIVRRRTGDIVQSCLKTGYMVAYEDAEGWVSWVHQYEEKFVEMMKAKLDYKVIWPERMVDGDYKQLKELIGWLGLTWSEDVLKYINPLLWNKKNKTWLELQQQRLGK